MNGNILNFFLVMSLLTFLNPLQVHAQNEAEDSIARVIQVTGEVNAVSPAGDSRPLQRGSSLFLGETFVTGPSSYAQVRLRDSMLIAFQPNTLFTFEEFEYDGTGGAGDTAIMTLLRGGFRTISGSIGEDAADEYRIDTPLASVAIRGTTHSAYFDPIGNVLYTGVEDGGTRIFNALGFIDLGLDGSYDFSETLAGEAPEGLLEQPPQLIALPTVDTAALAGGGNFAAPAGTVALQNNEAANLVLAALSPLSALSLSSGDDGDALIRI